MRYTKNYLDIVLFDTEDKFVEIKGSEYICDNPLTIDGLSWNDGIKYLNSELIWGKNIDYYYNIVTKNQVEGVL